MAVIQTKLTNASGIAAFVDVPYGSGYTLNISSVNVPDGYQAYTSSAFAVNATTPDKTIAIQPAVGNDLSLSVLVQNASSTGIPGAGVTLYADAAKTIALGAEKTTDGTGTVSFDHLVGATAGRNYYVSMTTVPSGYDDPLAFDKTVAVTTGVTPAQQVYTLEASTKSFNATLSDTNYSNLVYANTTVTLEQ